MLLKLALILHRGLLKALLLRHQGLLGLGTGAIGQDHGTRLKVLHLLLELCLHLLDFAAARLVHGVDTLLCRLTLVRFGDRSLEIHRGDGTGQRLARHEKEACEKEELAKHVRLS